MSKQDINEGYGSETKRNVTGNTIVFIFACTTTKEVVHIEDGTFIKIEGKKYLVSQRHQVETRSCISNDSDVLNMLKSGEDKEFKKQELTTVRRVTRPGSIIKAIPHRHLEAGVEYNFNICIDQSGDVVLTRLIDSNTDLNRSELKKLLSYILDYKYSEDMNADCLECGSYRIIIEKKNGFR